MGGRELTQNEILDLIREKNGYVEGGLKRALTLVVSSAGFSIATLSVNSIPPEVNLFVNVVVLIGLFISLMLTVRRDNPLKNKLERLSRECGAHEGSRSILREMNVWIGFSHGKTELWMPVLIAVLFMLYALVELAVRVWSPTAQC